MFEESKLFEQRIDKQQVILNTDAQQMERLFNKITSAQLAALKTQQQNAENIRKAIAALEAKYAEATTDTFKAELAQQLSDQKDALAETKAQIKATEEEIAEVRKKERQRVVDTTLIYEQNRYKKMSARQKLDYQKSIVEKAKAEKKALEEKYALQEAEHTRLNKIINSKSKNVSEEDKQKARAERDALIQEKQETRTELSSVSNQQEVAEGAVDALFKAVATSAEKRKQAQEAYEQAAQTAEEKKAEYLNFEEEQLKKIRAARLKGNTEEAKQLQTELANRKAIADAAQDEADLLKEKYKDAEKEAKKDEDRKKRLEDAEKKREELLEGFTGRKQLDENLDAVYGDQAKYLAKLKGSTEDWRESVDNVSDAIGFSGIVSKKNVIGKMKDLVDSGIAYNIEMRAFLAETSANIASTFNATNSSLLRIIRLQQQDSTAARLGMEATLTRLFNQYFEDSSYLASDLSESVSAAILDASATMTRDQSLEFEYTMQKWLGSLYSLGLSESAVQSIATGINYLGTGNVSALNSNASLQTLLTMSASKAGGKTYAEMLTTGLTSEDTNKLLKSMIEYLAEIANSQDNMVTKSAYADLFGMSVTDLSSFASLTTTEINNLYKNTVSYSDLMNETSTRLSEISSNMSLTDMVNTAIDNAQVGVATTIGSNAFTYGMWKALGLLQDYVGEIKIPSVLAAGFGLSSDIDLINVAQTGLVGFGAIGSLLGGLSSMMNGGVTNFNNWDFRESTSRGGSLSVLNQGSSASTSYSATIGVGSTSSSDVEAVSMQSAQDKAYEASGTTSEEIEEGREIPQKIFDVLGGESTPTILDVLQDINTRLDPGRIFYTAIAGTLTSESAEKVFTLSAQLATAKSSMEAASSDYTNSAISDVAKAVSSIGVGGSGLVTTAEKDENLSVLIEDAVRAAVSSVLDNYSITGVPVNVKGGL